MSHEADELVLYADHDEPLYRQSFQPIIANLKKKIAKGTYSPTMAVKLWRYHADRAAQKYAKEFGGTWHKIFSTKDRQEAAEHWEGYARREYLGVTSHDRSRRRIPQRDARKPSKPSKYVTLFVVQGNYGYGHGWEDVTAEGTRKEALARLREYRANENAPFRLITRRVLRAQAAGDRSRKRPKARTAGRGRQ